MLHFISQIIDDFRAQRKLRVLRLLPCGHLGYTSGNVTDLVPRVGTQTHKHGRARVHAWRIFQDARAGETNRRIANDGESALGPRGADSKSDF